MKTKSINTKIACFLSLALAISLSIVSMPAFTGLPIHQGTVHRTGATEESPLSTSPNTPYGGSYPAGMVTDGYNPFTNTYSQYNTTSFLAAVTISSIYAYNYSHLLHENDITFQLNAVLEFVSSGKIYSYWIQDVAELNTGTHEVYFLDNIWNFSSPSITMYDSSVTGNGSVNDFWGLFSGSYLYEDSASYFAPGNYISLNYPTTIQLKVTSELSDTGYPEVVFQYNDGYGWVTYDNAYFFTNNLESDSGFLVSGYLNTGYGLPYNAGIVMGGFGNGAGTTLQDANVTMSLTYWNGHNYQAPTFAQNNGADTAESVQGAGIEMTSDNGIPVAHLTTGATSPGSLYSQYESGQVSVSMPDINGTLLVRGSEGSTFESYGGGILTLTLILGNYNISTLGILPSAYGNVSVTGNSMTELVYQQFSETGLSSNLNWSINLTSASYGTESIFHGEFDNYFAVLLPYGGWVAEINAPRFYVPFQKDIQFNTNGSTVQIGFQGVGYLVGVVMPQSAQVYVNGSEIILQNGSFNISLAPGKYTIIANASGYSPYELNITVHFGSVSYNNIKLNRILNPSSGTNSLLELILVSVGTSGATGLGLMLYWKRRKG